MKTEAEIRQQVDEILNTRDFYDRVAYDPKSGASPVVREDAQITAAEMQAQAEVLIWVLGDHALHRPRLRFS